MKLKLLLNKGLLSFYLFLLFLLFSSPLLGRDYYTVTFSGTNSTIIQALKEQSQAVFFKNEPVKSHLQIKQRIKSDFKAFQEVMKSFGYYQSEFSYSLFPKKNLVSIHVYPGPLYRISSLECFVCSSPEDFSPLSFKELGLSEGDPADTQKILSAKKSLLDQSKKEGFPCIQMTKEDYTVDPSTHSLKVLWEISPGDRKKFGTTTIQGLKNVDPLFAKKMIRWKQGEIFSPDLIQTTEKAFENSNLFSTVLIHYPENSPSEELLPMTIEVVETKHRSISAGISFDTEHKGGFLIDWQNQNWRNQGEKLALHADFTGHKQQGALTHSLPFFHRTSQTLESFLSYQTEVLSHLHSHESSIGIRLERVFSKKFSGSLGTEFENIRVSRTDNNQSFNLMGFPIKLHLDLTNSPMNPSKGWRVAWNSTPFLGMSKTPSFLLQKILLNFYFPLSKDETLLLFSAINAGSLIGERRQEIPPSKRFYGGSESTLRGYKYKTVSPMQGGSPVGGRSLLVYTLELRKTLIPNLSLGTFFDMGNVYETLLPQLTKKLLKSVGVGARYVTPLGPLRFDVAFPLDKRPVDSAFQFYVSLGQEF